MAKTYLHPYIRGTDKLYGTDENGGFWGENGYNCIEVGYLEFDEHDNLVGTHQLTGVADVVHPVGLIPNSLKLPGYPKVPESIAMDCIGDGFMRIFSIGQRESLKWRHENMPMSSMELEIGEPSDLFKKHEVNDNV